ncbi:MAG TPA: XRE family transcriptional regulator [Cyanobacteria bacterium UBA11162]|nr:XRE family transcriptional regulator [Cyanobacteria bacterium UBA11162]
MPRALRIRGEFQKQVKLALTPNGFPSQKALAEEIGIALCTVSNFLNGKPVSLINFQEICFKLGLNWKEIADFNLPQNPLESNPDLNQESDLDTTRILLSDHSKNSYLIEQLCEELEAVRESVFISEDWQQFSNEELNQYNCFLLLLSHHSAQISNIIMEEIQRVQELRNSRSNGQPVIFLIHVDSVMSLPLNHPLLPHLQGILQRELPQTDIQTLVQEILELLQADPLPKPPVESNDLKQFSEKISNLNLSKNWLLTYIGEDQLLKLGALEDDLKNKGDRRIQSGYSYWGVGPVQMWNWACTDRTYHMRKNILEFPHYARQLAQYVDKERYNFVSLGVGEGSKDRSILSDFFNKYGSIETENDFLYIPVDMSLDMLRVAVETIQETNPLPLHRCIAIQRDFESFQGMQEIAYIAQSLGSQKPILYGFIGNTIANVENPKQVLGNIVNVMRTEDLLIFEAQIVNASVLEVERRQETIESVQREYLSHCFRNFALSALLQNTDLTIEPNERGNSYIVDVDLYQWDYGQVLQIDCFFENNTDRPLYMTLITEETVMLDKKERIRLYRSRKFPQHTLHNFVHASGLRILGQNQYLSEKGTGFIVMMLQRQN